MNAPFVDNVLELNFRNKPYSYYFSSGIYSFQLWGAGGGGLDPGFGAYVSGTLKIMTRTKLHIYIGQKGINDGEATYNGGGFGCLHGSSGGGSTDVRLKDGNWDDFESLKSRIIVAGAGAGSSSSERYKSKGGNAGIFEGSEGSSRQYSTSTVTNAKGGKQNEGGKPGIGRKVGIKGEFGKGGGSNGEENYYGNGGGSGYFGGGGGAIDADVVGSGAGGSSFVSGLQGCNAILKSSTEDHILFSNLPFHYSYHIFTNITYQNGKDVQWKEDGKVIVTFITRIRDRYFSCKVLAPRSKLGIFVFIIISSNC